LFFLVTAIVEKGNKYGVCFKFVLPIVAVCGALMANILWAIHAYILAEENKSGIVAIVFISPILISAGWVTNFMTNPDVVRNYLKRLVKVTSLLHLKFEK